MTADPQRTMQVHLTAEQAQLYRTSPTFRHGADTMLRGVVPQFLAGLAATAAAEDQEADARRRASHGAWAAFRD